MNRVGVEYGKAGLMAALAVVTAVLLVISGGAPALIALPVVFAGLAVYFWWKADVFSRDRR